jgi:cytochrome c-type biogenesis protein CcsB
MQQRLMKFADKFFNTRAAGIYILLFAFAIALATFVENDFGTSAAQKVIFKSWWFELLLFLFSFCLAVNIIRYRMIQNKRWALFMFHFSMIIILFGAGVTRYFGFEGMMHIREGDASNEFLSAESYLQFEVQKGSKNFKFHEPVLFASLGNNSFDEEYLIGNDLIKVRLEEYIPNPSQELIESEDGAPLIKVVFGGAGGREEYYLRMGDTKRINGVLFNFNNKHVGGAVNIGFENNNLTIQSNSVLSQTVMATQERDTLYPDEGPHLLRLRSLYSDGVNSFVFGDFNPSAMLQLSSESRKVKKESLEALQLSISVNGEQEEAVIYGRKAMQGRPAILNFGDLSLAVSYGALTRELPFSIKLYDFQMERYPGTNSAASYASEVQLIDSRKNYKMDYRIYMNHILNYGGYRFFQSSFDRDERGTYLSVNHDFWGTWISYIGYILLTIGLVMSFFSKSSRFSQVIQKLKKKRMRTAIAVILFMTLSSVNDAYTQKRIDLNLNTVDRNHAKLFSELVVQDHKGRMKPLHTLNRELIRKISRNESLFGLTADQIVLSMYADRQNWLDVPIIKSSKHPKIQELLGLDSKLIAYKDFFNSDGSYKLRDEVRTAYAMQTADRTSYDKDLMKIDERLNIVSMIFSDRIFKIIPVPDDPNNTWVSSHINEHGQESVNQPIAPRFFESYQNALHKAMHSGDYGLPNQIINELKAYQNDKGGEVMPSQAKIGLEILLNKFDVFGRLSSYYIFLGLGFLVLLFMNVFKPRLDLNRVYKVLFSLVILGFIFHTTGLGIRWYVSGRAPWSNGYESMIYIAFTSALAGLIFTRKSYGGMAATMVLAGTILLVAKLSYLDPEITPLVPVLRSYWLTIHVSLIAGSYGFLMLGALIGLINLILFMFLSESNKERVKLIVQEMSYISEITLIGGLVMISIGTYLGGVWANESWGRYWGWDAKETWALVTILVYAFILHMRIIPKLNGLYLYNLAKLFGWASVIMTYFGVNYYLSGLHSYAAGDPIPIPNWVYISLVSCTIISLLAWLKYRKFVA